MTHQHISGGKSSPSIVNHDLIMVCLLSYTILRYVGLKHISTKTVCLVGLKPILKPSS